MHQRQVHNDWQHGHHLQPCQKVQMPLRKDCVWWNQATSALLQGLGVNHALPCLLGRASHSVRPHPRCPPNLAFDDTVEGATEFIVWQPRLPSGAEEQRTQHESSREGGGLGQEGAGVLPS